MVGHAGGTGTLHTIAAAGQLGLWHGTIGCRRRLELVLKGREDCQHKECAGSQHKDGDVVVLRNDHVAEHSAGTQDFTDNADAGKGDGKTKAHADTDKCGSHRSVRGRIRQ